VGIGSAGPINHLKGTINPVNISKWVDVSLVDFDRTVSGIAEFGLFVRMDDNWCEGMVPMASIPGDRYFFDAEKYRIIGSRTKVEFNFGDRVKVKISEVYPRKRQIDLALVTA
jgi:ribonuclease R